jgi:hypothetical protein
MTQDEIIEMARQARLVERIDECHRAIRPKWIEDHDITTYVEAFAKLVAAKEREQIIAITETQEFSRMYGEFTPSAYDFVKAIRARGEA